MCLGRADDTAVNACPGSTRGVPDPNKTYYREASLDFNDVALPFNLSPHEAFVV